MLSMANLFKQALTILGQYLYFCFIYIFFPFFVV